MNIKKKPIKKKGSKKDIFVIVGIVALVIGAGVWFAYHPPADATLKSSANAPLPGIQTGDAPWTAELDHLRERLSAIDLPTLSAEGTALHIHQHLDIFIDGKPVIIPALIGINNTQQFISSIHVHDTTGIIHVESPIVTAFTLGQFFNVWGVSLSTTTIGGYSANGDKKLQFFVNGVLQPATQNPRDMILSPHEEIVIAYGTQNELPNPIPSSYVFPPGY